LYVTHDQIEAMSLSSRLAVMNQGKIEQIGPPQEVYERPKTPFVEDFLGRILRFRARVVEKKGSDCYVELEGSGALACVSKRRTRYRRSAAMYWWQFARKIYNCSPMTAQRRPTFSAVR
jgi:ABC-type Fe3+/spermidine/putrescine transport system ATPase subunit